MSSSDVAIAHGGKTSWPELVGKHVEEAKEIIHRDRPDFKIVVLPDGTPVDKIFDPMLVRIYITTIIKNRHKEAEGTILEDNPDLENVVLPVGTLETEDVNIIRGPPFIGIVAQVPHIG